MLKFAAKTLPYRKYLNFLYNMCYEFYRYSFDVQGIERQYPFGNNSNAKRRRKMRLQNIGTVFDYSTDAFIPYENINRLRACSHKKRIKMDTLFFG